jgi:hypothetical protein
MRPTGWPSPRIVHVPLIRIDGGVTAPRAHRQQHQRDSVVNIDIRLEACRQPWALAGLRLVAGWARHAGAAAAAGSCTVPRAIVVVLAHPKGVHAGGASWEHSLTFAAPFNLARILNGAVAFSPCLECSISIDLVAKQPFDLRQPAQEDALTFGAYAT